MYKDWSFEEVEEKAEAIKAIGLDEVYLSNGEKPWHLATHCEKGGSHRLDIATNVWFSGISPSGIPIRWSFEIEPPSANGKGTYQIDVDGCSKVLASLKEPCRAEFQRYLSNCADAVEKNAKELARLAEGERQTAQTLRSI